MIAFSRTCAVFGVLALVAATAGRGTLAADVPAAEPAVPLQAEDERQLVDRAAALRADAGQRRQAAERQLTQRNAACQRKFLVSSCLEKARRDHMDSKQEARRLELQANDIERELTRRKRALDAAERERRAAEKLQDAQRFRAQREAQAQESAARDADRARRLEEGQARAGTEAQARQQQDAEKARRRAEKVEQARQRAEDAQRQRAELDRRVEEKERRKAEKAARQDNTAPGAAIAK